ncbi:unnamed protein product [Adineta steineri]|uniref:Uncharacterized protein n=1 Tax=Adineta steineri TaxID=433720 RepID=A0A819EK35_9BILA|nr:unnamed protein product [Adineta steineri]CAF3853379.1 unnamed protein product [Adineta steineri]
MEMSKCLCLMIIAVIVIAANASPFRERRNSGNHGNSGQGWSNRNQGTNSVSNTQYSNTETTNNCNGANQVCCDNQAILKSSCGNGATGGASGTQYNGCYAGQSCCQGNTSGLIDISCSDVSTSSSPSS